MPAYCDPSELRMIKEAGGRRMRTALDMFAETPGHTTEVYITEGALGIDPYASCMQIYHLSYPRVLSTMPQPRLSVSSRVKHSPLLK